METINKMLKPTILSISMATVMAGAAISPALGLMQEAFPEASPTFIKLILTAPSLMIIPFSFVSSYLTQKMTKRSILMIGLLIYLIAGIAPQFINNIEIIFILRLVLGAGVGLVMPLSMSLINDYYTDTERTKMMGYNSAFSNFGGIITMLVAGWLASFGWQVPFNVYFLGLAIFILVYFYLPKGDVQKKSESSKKNRLPIQVYGYALAMGAVMLAYYSIATNIALYLEQNALGGATLAGTVVSFTTVGGMITSFFLVRIEMTFKQYIIPVMLTFMALAFFLLSITNLVPIVILSVCFVGFGQGALFPVITLKALDKVELHQADRVVAWTSSFTFLGQFMSPIVLDTVGKLFNQEAIRFQYTVLSIAIFLIVILTFMTIFKNSRSLQH